MEAHNEAMAPQPEVSQQETMAAGAAAADVPAAEPPAAEPQLDDGSVAAQLTDADTGATRGEDASSEPTASGSHQQLQPQQEQEKEEQQVLEEAPAPAAVPVPTCPAAADDGEQQQPPVAQQEQDQQQHEEAAQPSSNRQRTAALAVRGTAAQTRTLAATAGCLPKGLTFTGPPYVPKAKPYRRMDYSHSAVQLLKIEHDNHLLFNHLTTIGSAASPKRPGAIAPCNVASSAVNRRKAATTIAQENHALYQRLVAIRPSKDISRDTLEAEHRQAEGYRINCAQFKPGHTQRAKAAAAAST